MSYVVVAFREPTRWGIAEMEKLNAALPGVSEELVRAAYRAMEPTSGGIRQLYLRDFSRILGTSPRARWGWVEEEGCATQWHDLAPAMEAAREQLRAPGLFHVVVGQIGAVGGRGGTRFAEQQADGGWRYYGPEPDDRPPVCRTCACVRSEGPCTT